MKKGKKNFPLLFDFRHFFFFFCLFVKIFFRHDLRPLLLFLLFVCLRVKKRRRVEGFAIVLFSLREIFFFFFFLCFPFWVKPTVIFCAPKLSSSHSSLHLLLLPNIPTLITLVPCPSSLSSLGDFLFSLSFSWLFSFLVFPIHQIIFVSLCQPSPSTPLPPLPPSHHLLIISPFHSRGGDSLLPPQTYRYFHGVFVIHFLHPLLPPRPPLSMTNPFLSDLTFPFLSSCSFFP